MYIRPGVIAEIKWSFVPENPWEFYVFYSFGRFLVFVSTIWSYGQI